MYIIHLMLVERFGNNEFSLVFKDSRESFEKEEKRREILT